ncbi:unnamed protein product [Trichobilharzia szidati]|nr:unnamed protein product [Trichobilharzia szidati]
MHKGRSRTSDVYRVEHLVDKRIRGNRTEYLVKWKNWSDEHNTWEPAKNILDKRLIESYERREKRKKNQLASSSSSTPRDRSHSTESQRSPLHSPERHQQQQQQQPQQHVKSEENLNLHESSSLSPIKSSLASIDPILSTFLPPNISTGSTSYNSDLPLISSSSQSIKSPHASSTTTSIDSTPSQWELSELCYDRRFRRTTLLVAAASASAANAAAALAHSRQSGRQAQHSSTTGSSTGHTTATTTTTPASTTITNTASNTNIISTTASIENTNSTVSLQAQSKMTKTEAITTPLSDENIEARPKIRLTIPRDRILPCPPIGVSSNSSASSANNTSINSSSSSSSNQCLDDSDHSISMTESTSVRHDVNTSGLFVAPVELPRRCYNTATALSPHSLMNPTGGMRLPDIQIDNRSHLHDYETSKSPKWNKQSPCTK